MLIKDGQVVLFKGEDVVVEKIDIEIEGRKNSKVREGH